jgi:hypothetical protein
MKTATNAPDSLRILWADGWFMKPKNLGETKMELEKRGYNFTDANLAMALRSSKFLTRRGQRKQFTYVQKHPFIKETDHGHSGN